ncbi:MAG: hypothetical protein MUC50_16960 [Myxococcota bacterium]|nr:hypothetical protein [Myxococcota bacterium]
MKCFTSFDKADVKPLLESCRQSCQVEANADEREAESYVDYNACVNEELSTDCQEATTKADEAADNVENCAFRCQSGLGCTEWLSKDFQECNAECEILVAEAEAFALEKSNACDAELKAAAKKCRNLSPVVTECSPGCSASVIT